MKNKTVRYQVFSMLFILSACKRNRVSEWPLLTPRAAVVYGDDVRAGKQTVLVYS